MSGAIPLISINGLMVWTRTILLYFYFLRRIIRIRTVLTEWADAYVIRTFVPLLNIGTKGNICKCEAVIFQKTENSKFK